MVNIENAKLLYKINEKSCESCKENLKKTRLVSIWCYGASKRFVEKTYFNNYVFLHHYMNAYQIRRIFKMLELF